jgi:glycosyltransferase involved in cell wall biosynthesis
VDDVADHRPPDPAPDARRGRLRVAYTVEQCWHSVPGGTAIAALRVARELEGRDAVDLRYVAGRHPRPPRAEFRPRGPVAMLPVSGAVLYELWNRANWPRVESVVGEIDVVHATGLVPAATGSPLVVTVHDIAFVHEPENFSRHGARTMNRSLDTIRRRADRVICSSCATVDDLVANGFDRERLRHVPLGVDAVVVSASTVERARRRYGLPERFVLFVGTVEPRKNLARLAAAIERRAGREPLVVVGAEGWGEGGLDRRDDVHFLGFVPERDLAALYGAASVFAYPSLREGFGLPVAEAMAQGTPVVTSRGTSTEEVAGGAAVLVDPADVDDIAAGIDAALDDGDVLAARGRARAAELTWAATADATVAVYRELAR